MLGQALDSRPEQEATCGNDDALFNCFNVGMVFELMPHKAKQIVAICVVIKSHCRIIGIHLNVPKN